MYQVAHLYIINNIYSSNAATAAAAAVAVCCCYYPYDKCCMMPLGVLPSRGIYCYLYEREYCFPT